MRRWAASRIASCRINNRRRRPTSGEDWSGFGSKSTARTFSSGLGSHEPLIQNQKTVDMATTVSTQRGQVRFGSVRAPQTNRRPEGCVFTAWPGGVILTPSRNHWEPLTLLRVLSGSSEPSQFWADTGFFGAVTALFCRVKGQIFKSSCVEGFLWLAWRWH